MRHSFVVLALSLLEMGLASKSSLAATVSTSFGVSVTVVSSCRALPSLPAVSSPRTNTISSIAPDVAVDCTLPTPHNVEIRTTVVSESIAATQKLDGNAMGRYHARTFDTRAADDESLSHGTYPDVTVVTISY